MYLSQCTVYYTKVTNYLTRYFKHLNKPKAQVDVPLGCPSTQFVKLNGEWSFQYQLLYSPEAENRISLAFEHFKEY